jgi:hypothetical protein
MLDGGRRRERKKKRKRRKNIAMWEEDSPGLDLPCWLYSGSQLLGVMKR